MTFKVAITSFRTPSEATRRVIRDAGFDLVERACETERQVIEAASDADAALIAIRPLTNRHILESLPKLKMVGRHGVGVDSVDLDAATELGIMVCNTPGMNTSEVADHAMALLLSVNRRIPWLNAGVKRGLWGDMMGDLNVQIPQLLRIAGGIVGILGFGNIGRAFATRVRGFGPARIVAYDPYVPQTTGDLYGVKMVEFDELLSTSDFVSAHTPLNEETHHILDAAAFRKMKSTAVVINTSRGPVIDEAGLHEALTRGYIAGAGIDVTEVEPLDNESPLTKLDNLIITPHFAGYSEFSATVGSTWWAENVVRVLTGVPPLGLANPDVIKTIAVQRSQGDARWADVPV